MRAHGTSGLRSAVVAWMLLGSVAAAVQAATIHVTTSGNDNADGLSWATAKRTVQAGLGAAAGGDQVWVAAGRYVERITLGEGVALYGGFAGTETNLFERDWATNVAILDGHHGGSVVTGPWRGTATTRIDGFTITNGSAAYGAGLYLSQSSPTVANNTITGNRGSNGGAGLYLYNCSSMIINNTITGNRVRVPGGPAAGTVAHGGGLAVEASSPTILNNTIAGNSVSAANGWGGGLYITACPSFTIAGNTIRDNSASHCGGGLYAYDSTVAITDNTFARNSAASGGGLYVCNHPFEPSPTVVGNRIVGNSAGSGAGLYLYYCAPTVAGNVIAGNSGATGGGLYLSNSRASVVNNTITGNSVFGRDADGGGLYLYYSSPTLTNTIVAFNSSGIHKDGGSVTPRYDCVYGNTRYDFSNMPDDTGLFGNISVDPRFVRQASAGTDGFWGTADDDYGDLRLLAGSPCIDAGGNAHVPADTADLDADGNRTEPLPFDIARKVRFLDDAGTADTGAGTPPIVDMGACEHRPEIPGDANGDGHIGAVDLLYLVHAFGSASGDVRYDPRCDFNGDGAVDVGDLLILMGSFGI